MTLDEVHEGQRVRLCGPREHRLHGRLGIVARVFTPEEMWLREPMTMMGDPFAWTTGQVLISLARRPRGGPHNLPWTPGVSVRPEDIELALLRFIDIVVSSTDAPTHRKAPPP